MKAALLLLLLATAALARAQEPTDEYSGGLIFTSMKLEPVMQYSQLSNCDIAIYSTMNVIVFFCDKAIRVPAGCHRIRVSTIEDKCRVTVMDDGREIDLDSQSISVRIIKDGIQEIKYDSSSDPSFPKSDYKEYTVCEFFSFRVTIDEDGE